MRRVGGTGARHEPCLTPLLHPVAAMPPRVQAEEILAARQAIHPVLQAEWDLRCGSARSPGRRTRGCNAPCGVARVLGWGATPQA